MADKATPTVTIDTQDGGDGEGGVLMADIRFGVADYVVFCLMLVVSCGVGVYSAIYYRSKTNPNVLDFLLGNRRMPALPVALSLLGGVISALSILGNATEIYLYGTQLSVNLVGSVIGVLMIRSVVLPIFFSLNLVSIMQYLELRFDSSVLRKLATFCQLLGMFFYLGICLYAPSLALTSVTSLPTYSSIIFLGAICTIYVTIGGVRAVVYTDVIQTTLMFAGVLTVVVKVSLDMGGLGVIWDAADEGHRIEFFNMNPSPFVRHTFWSTGVLGFYFVLTTVGLSQAQYQRLASVKNIQHSQWLLKVFLVGLLLLWGIFYLSGLVAYATYRDCDPLTSGRIDKADQIVPYLVADKLGMFPGLPGLFVAAVYGGVLSSMSSQANAIACLVWEDLLKDTQPFANVNPKKAVIVVKVITALAGVSGMGLALVVGRLGSLFSVAYSVSGAILGPLDGLYMAGIFMPWVNKKGAVTGLITSFLISQWRVIGNLLKGGGSPPHLPLSTDGCPENYFNYTTITNMTTTTTTATAIATTTFPSNHEVIHEGGHSFYDISYCYNGVIGIAVTMVVCCIVSLLTNPLPPGAVDHRLTNPTLARLYRRLWEALARRGMVREAEKGKQEVEMDNSDVKEEEKSGDEYEKNKNNMSNNERNKKLEQEELSDVEDYIPQNTSLSSVPTQTTLAMDTT